VTQHYHMRRMFLAGALLVALCGVQRAAANDLDAIPEHGRTALLQATA
jgi:hypothetical protein